MRNVSDQDKIVQLLLLTSYRVFSFLLKVYKNSCELRLNTSGGILLLLCGGKLRAVSDVSCNYLKGFKF